jgi:beta-1,4-mannosyltransferase
LIVIQLKLEENIKVKSTFEFPAIFNWCLPRFISCFLKILWDALALLLCLPLLSGPDFIVLQNPPALPALPLCYFYTLLHRRTKLVLDWHNYDHLVTGLSLGSRHPLVYLIR